MDMLRRYVELETLRRKHEADLKEAKSELELLQRQLLQVFEQNGIQNMKVNGMTVFLYRQLWAGIAKQGQEATVEERTTACNALKQANLGIYVYEQFNSQSISAYVREAVKNGDELPECFVMLERGRNVGPEHFGKIAVTEKYELRTRKS
jgi:hypothetical protein